MLNLIGGTLKKTKLLAILLILVSSPTGPAWAETFSQSKTFDLNGNFSWSFNEDCSKSIALWPTNVDPGKEWITVLPGQTLNFNLSPITVDRTSYPSCQAIESSKEAAGADRDNTVVLQVDSDGDGTYQAVSSPWSFSTPALSQRIEPYRISAYWEAAPGQRIVNEYWIYVGNSSSMSINSAALMTSFQDVTLNISPPPGTATMQVSNDAGFTSPQSFSAGTSISWQLTPPDLSRVSKVVYCRFFDRDGKMISSLSDDIILDGFAPQISKIKLLASKGSPRFSLSKSKKAKTYTLRVSADDAISGVRFMEIADSASPVASTSRNFSTSVKLKTIPGKKVFVRLQDGAGNWTVWRSIKPAG